MTTTLSPGTLVTFPHKQRQVVAYVDSVDETVGGHAANCMGVIVEPGTGRPHVFNWRVPVDADLVVLQTPTNCRRCSECRGERHHWIDDAAYSCKHCEVMVPRCDDCDEPAETGHVCENEDGP